MFSTLITVSVFDLIEIELVLNSHFYIRLLSKDYIIRWGKNPTSKMKWD
jgi:hypothetical protein